MKRKLLSVLIAFAMIMSLMPALAFADDGDYFTQIEYAGGKSASDLVYNIDAGTIENWDVISKVTIKKNGSPLGTYVVKVIDGGYAFQNTNGTDDFLDYGSLLDDATGKVELMFGKVDTYECWVPVAATVVSRAAEAQAREAARQGTLGNLPKVKASKPKAS